MQVKDGLTGAGAVVDNHPEITADAVLLGQIGPSFDDFSHQPVIFVGHRDCICYVFFGDDEKMFRRLWGYIPKRQYFIIFIHLLGGDFPGYNLAENAVNHSLSPHCVISKT
jgi:hypothetical protein